MKVPGPRGSKFELSSKQLNSRRISNHNIRILPANGGWKECRPLSDGDTLWMHSTSYMYFDRELDCNWISIKVSSKSVVSFLGAYNEGVLA